MGAKRGATVQEWEGIVGVDGSLLHIQLLGCSILLEIVGMKATINVREDLSYFPEQSCKVIVSLQPNTINVNVRSESI
jgi:hypothetical protein